MLLLVDSPLAICRVEEQIKQSEKEKHNKNKAAFQKKHGGGHSSLE